jgi:choline dehydrogenase-like flavoprotein
LRCNREALNAEGFFFGNSRLAVNFEPHRKKSGCVYCGMCLYGCPYGHIYSTGFTLDWLAKKKNFHYRKGIIVERLVESKDEVRIVAKSITDSKTIEFRGSRVFLAAGLLSSTRILLQSLEAFHHPVMIQHSEHFQMPLLRYKKTRNLLAEELHTLTQLTIEIIDEFISENTVNMQVYAYNDLYPKALNRLMGPLSLFVKGPMDAFIGRLLIIKGYLHSNISSHILAYLQPGADGKLLLEGRPNEVAQRTLNKIVAKLFRNRKSFKAIPVPILAKISLPGTGNHSGGSFPMKKKPAEFETDVLGRPYGFKKIHVTDATVFPSIPATTISLSIMANAHRIASAC